MDDSNSNPPALPPKPHAASRSSIPPKVPPRSSSIPLSTIKESKNASAPIQQPSNEPSNNTVPPLVQAQQVTGVSSSLRQTQTSLVDNCSMPPPQQHTSLYTNPSYGVNDDKVVQQPGDREYASLNYMQPFNKLLEENAIDLPLQVNICESIYGMMGGESLFEEEKLDVYFLKHTEVVKIKNSGAGTTNWLPLCSAYQCNVFTCKDGRFVTKKEFPSMDSLLTTSILPLIVYVTVGCKKSLTCSSIQAGELLIIKSVEVTKKNKVKSMNCWSISTHEQKHLDGSCKAHFSTKTEQTKVYIHDVINHYKLPMYAIFYFSACSVERMVIEERLVIKSAITKKVAVESSEIFEIILMADMMTKKREVANNYYKELVKRSRSLYDKFNPTFVNKVISSVPVGYDSFQTKLFKHVLANWNKSTKLYCPTHSTPMPPSIPNRRVHSSPAINVEESPPLPPMRNMSNPTIHTETPDLEYEEMTFDVRVTTERTSPKPPPSGQPQDLQSHQVTTSSTENEISQLLLERAQHLHENQKTLNTYNSKHVSACTSK